MDDFVVGFCQKLRKDDFTNKNENYSITRKGKRECLSDSQTRELVNALNQHFQNRVNIPRIRMGKSQEIETLISEESLQLAIYLREEYENWKPRIVTLR